MKRAALYARVSTELQKDEQTIKTQVNEIKRAIEADGCALIEDCIYQDDGWSGALIERPDLDRLRQDAKDEKFDIVYVYDRGRLSRKFVYQEIIIEEMSRYGVEFNSLHDVNGTSPEEQLMGSVMGVFHEYERVKIAERFRLGKLNKVRSGQLLGYIPCYGYDYVPIKGKGTNKQNGYFVINEEEANVVRMMYEWVGIECISLREVIRRLYEMGIPPKKQKRPTWTKGPVSRLLQNETYIGKHYYYKREAVIPKTPSAKTSGKYKQRHTNKTSRRIRDKSEWLMVKVPIIVDEQLFYKVQAQLKLNSKYSPRNKKHNYLLSGLIYCSCGERRVGDGPDGKKYYRCTARLHSFPIPARCRVAGVNVTVLDSVCWEKLSTLLTDPKLIEQQISRYAKKKLIGAKKQQNESQVQQNLKTLDLEERRYAKLYGQGTMSEDVYEDMMKNVTDRRKALKKLVEKADDDSAQFQNIDTKELVKPFQDYIKELTFEGKVFTVRKIVDKIIATKEEVTINGFIPVMDISSNGKDKLNAIDSYIKNSTAPNTKGQVKLSAIYRNCWTAKCR